MSSSMLDWFLSTLTPTDANGMHSAFGQVPSTAEIIQKCLTVNPFDRTFREANRQISSGGCQGGSQGQSPADAQNGLASIALPSMLKLPSLSSQSPGIFSNISVLTAADFDEIGKNIDLASISKKIQQLRESRDEASRTGNREPRTADVIEGVIDVEFNRNHMACSSMANPATTTSSLAAGLSAAQDFLNAAAAYGQISNLAAVASNQPASTTAPMCAPSTSNMIDVLNHSATSQAGMGQPLSCVTSSGDFNATSGFQFSSPPGMRKPQFSDLAAATTAAFLQQQHQQQQQSNKLPAETLLALQTSCSLNSNLNLTVPSHLGARSSGHNSPANSCHVSGSAAVSPGSAANLTELKKASSTVDLLMSGVASIESHHSASSAPSTIDPWENTMDIKPNVKPVSSMTQQSLSNQNPYYHSQSNMFNSGLGDGNSSGHESSGRKSTSSRADKPRKYTRYNANSSNGSNETQVSSTRGGRGRRSLTAEMPPDERRNTILERNKAAAVRYRKRKKEEHDEMMGRVSDIEQQKLSLQTRNTVLQRELERVTNLLKARDSRCVCNASQLGVTNMLGEGLNSGGDHSGRDHQRSPMDFGQGHANPNEMMMNATNAALNLNQMNNNFNK
ncbi:cyclic AMP-dependent transcription factor ATF-7 [Ditylenchus destructor]|nr:cyclic AMP-dependent transcription factor ATF-7 [Ditylenchus destructor]